MRQAGSQVRYFICRGQSLQIRIVASQINERGQRLI